MHLVQCRFLVSYSCLSLFLHQTYPIWGTYDWVELYLLHWQEYLHMGEPERSEELAEDFVSSINNLATGEISRQVAMHHWSMLTSGKFCICRITCQQSSFPGAMATWCRCSPRRYKDMLPLGLKWSKTFFSGLPYGWPPKPARFCPDCKRETQIISAQKVPIGIWVSHLYSGLLFEIVMDGGLTKVGSGASSPEYRWL